MTHLTHDDVLRVRGLHDGRLHKVTLTVVTVPSGQNLQAGRRFGVMEPPLDPSEGLKRDQLNAVRNRRDEHQ